MIFNIYVYKLIFIVINTTKLFCMANYYNKPLLTSKCTCVRTAKQGSTFMLCFHRSRPSTVWLNCSGLVRDYHVLVGGV